MFFFFFKKKTFLVFVDQLQIDTRIITLNQFVLDHLIFSHKLDTVN